MTWNDRITFDPAVMGGKPFTPLHALCQIGRAGRASTNRYIPDQALASTGAVSRPNPFSIGLIRRESSPPPGRNWEARHRTDRRDLSGVRLVLYTNNDVDAFLSSGLIRENFEVEEDSTKVHHPREENTGAQYRAIHFTVQLGEGRIGLAEYARFEGLRCEIQIQTILNHAWSETSHDNHLQE